MYDDKRRKRLDPEEVARRHPLRVRILDLYAQDENRSLAAADLLRDLPDETTQSAVAYHVRMLQAVGLLPEKGSSD